MSAVNMRKKVQKSRSLSEKKTTGTSKAKLRLTSAKTAL